MNFPRLEIANLAIAATSSTNSKATLLRIIEATNKTTLIRTIEATVKLRLQGKQEFVMNFPEQEIVNLAIDATSFTELRDSKSIRELKCQRIELQKQTIEKK